MKILLVSPQSKVWSSPKLLSLGMAHVASALERDGHTVAIYDAVVETESLEDVLRRARDSREANGRSGRFDVVGIAATTPLINEAWEAAELARQYGAISIFGGPHLSIDPAGTVAKPYADFAVKGEGEQGMAELLQVLATYGLNDPAEETMVERLTAALANPKLVAELKEVKGLHFKELGGEIYSHPEQSWVPDLNELPLPAYHLFKIDRYSNLQPLTDGIKKNPRAFTILTTRGCPYACTFCSRPVTGRTWRMRSLDSVLNEWRYLVKDMKATEIGIADDVFNLNLGRAKELCRRIIAEGLNNVPWITIHGMRTNSTDLELFQLMKKAGCIRVGFGIESGNQKVLDMMKKKQTLDQVRSAMKNAKQAGLQTMGFFIFGMPGEDEAAMEDTIKFALELDPDMANFMLASPFPGTELYDIIKANGTLFVKDWADFAIHSDHARFEIGETKADIVERKWHEAYRRFYLRPGRLAKKAMRLDTWKHLPTYTREARRFFLSRVSKPKPSNPVTAAN